MALFLVRGGRHGEHEDRFLGTSAIYATWYGLEHDLGKCESPAEMKVLLGRAEPDSGEKKLDNYARQLWAFAKKMKRGDRVVLPRKHKSTIAVAEITGDYGYDGSQPDPYKHSRNVRWIATDVPRTSFDQDLLFSFGAFMTICEIKRNDAERRVRAMEAAGWPSSGSKPGPKTPDSPDEAVEGGTDFEKLARDEIAAHVRSRFSGHALAWLVDALLEAQGYTTHRSPPGPDGGVDILASPGPLGFGSPRICVQVKSGAATVDRPTLDQLKGAMQNVGADQGLLVSWSGFKTSVEGAEGRASFFKVRLWDGEDLLDQVLAHYDRLPADLRAELPLKRIWCIAQRDET